MKPSNSAIAALEVPLQINGYELDPGKPILDNPDRLVDYVRRAIQATQGRSLVAVDGPPGSWKTSIAKMLHDELQGEPNAGVVLHDMDAYKKTIAGTAERRRLHRSDEDFNELYCDDAKAYYMIKKLLGAKEGMQIIPGQVYSREQSGMVEADPITIPEGENRTVIFEGTGSIGISRIHQVDRFVPVHIYAHPELAKQFAMKRDEKLGKEFRPEFWERDITLAIRNRLMYTLNEPGIVFYDNNQNLANALRAS